MFKLLVSHGSIIQHKCVSRFKISNSENDQSGEELTKPATLLYRLCTNDNIPVAKLKDAINTLTLVGYNLSTDKFLKMESFLAVAKLKEDGSFYKSVHEKMTRSVSLLLQCRRAVIKALGDPYRNKVKMLSDIAVPNLIIDFLNFSDL